MTVLYSGEVTHLGGPTGETLCGRKTFGMKRTIVSDKPGSFIWENNVIGVWICSKCTKEFNRPTNHSTRN